MTGPALADYQVVVAEDSLARGLWMPSEVSRVYALIEERKQRVRDGLAIAPECWTKRLQAEIDPLLRVRWEYDSGGMWVVDRWVEAEHYWFPVASGVILEDRLMDVFRQGDLQRIGPDKRLEQKRTQARLRQELNDRKVDTRIDAAIDSMTVKQQMEFVQVEEAIAAGDTITAHGNDNHILTKLEDAARRNRSNRQKPSRSAGLGRRFKKLTRKI